MPRATRATNGLPWWWVCTWDHVLAAAPKLKQAGHDSEIFGWNPSSNNNYLYAGTGSMILNAISATARLDGSGSST